MLCSPAVWSGALPLPPWLAWVCWPVWCDVRWCGVSEGGSVHTAKTGIRKCWDPVCWNRRAGLQFQLQPAGHRGRLGRPHHTPPGPHRSTSSSPHTRGPRGGAKCTLVEAIRGCSFTTSIGWGVRGRAACLPPLGYTCIRTALAYPRSRVLVCAAWFALYESAHRCEAPI